MKAIEHALLATRLFGLLDYASPDAQFGSAPVDPARLRQARNAMRDLKAFRHDPDNRFVSSYIDNAIVEQYFIRNIETLFENDRDE